LLAAAPAGTELNASTMAVANTGIAGFMTQFPLPETELLPNII
jgi:hypothetical protein